MRASGGTVLVVARPFVVALCGAFALGVGCSGGDAATTYCVFESGALEPGTCLSECDSQCALVARAGCVSTDCAKQCKAVENVQSSPCRNAEYDYWRCLRLLGEPSVTCLGQGFAFVPAPSACVSERAARAAVCGSQDGGVLPLGPGEPGDAG